MVGGHRWVEASTTGNKTLPLISAHCNMEVVQDPKRLQNCRLSHMDLLVTGRCGWHRVPEYHRTL